jgi:hypothetical protein
VVDDLLLLLLAGRSRRPLILRIEVLVLILRRAVILVLLLWTEILILRIVIDGCALTQLQMLVVASYAKRRLYVDHSARAVEDALEFQFDSRSPVADAIAGPDALDVPARIVAALGSRRIVRLVVAAEINDPAELNTAARSMAKRAIATVAIAPVTTVAKGCADGDRVSRRSRPLHDIDSLDGSSTGKGRRRET